MTRFVWLGLCGRVCVRQGLVCLGLCGSLVYVARFCVAKFVG